MKYSFKFLAFTMLFTMLLGIASCVKTEFDEPPINGSDPEIPSDKIVSLHEILDLAIPGDFVEIEQDKYIQGVVVADDKSGNFYKSIIVEDENSDLGISVLIDEVETYTLFPVGRRVFIHLQDLWIADYAGLPQLGYGTYLDGTRERLAGIPSGVMREVILRGQYGIPVVPKPVKINQLGQSALNTLVQFDMVQFAPASAGKTFSDNVNLLAVNHSLTDCDGNSILVRTSGFASFAGALTPSGNGKLVGVYGIFNNDRQITLRNPEDLTMEAERCEAELISIGSLKDAFKSGATTSPSGIIEGVVISDRTSLNHNALNMVLQNGSEGILVRFVGSHTFAKGDKVMVDVSGGRLEEFRGLFQVNSLDPAKASVISKGNAVEPLEITIGDLLSSFDDFESTLVKIKGATITGGTTFAGGKTVKDGTGTIVMFTQNAAVFANQTYPTGTVDIVAIVSEFDSPQLLLNSSNDVSGGQGGGGGDLEEIPIAELRSVFKGSATTAPSGFIQGVVISDVSQDNITIKNLVIQSGEAGIVVRFVDNSSFQLGDELKITVSGAEISEFNGLLQLNNVPNSNAQKLGSNKTITPKEVTIKFIKDNLEALESTLVKIKDVTLSGTGKYSGTNQAQDATGTIDMFTRTQAKFASTNLPAGKVEVTAIVSQFNTAQINLRNLGDVK